MSRKTKVWLFGTLMVLSVITYEVGYFSRSSTGAAIAIGSLVVTLLTAVPFGYNLKKYIDDKDRSQ